MTKFHINKHGVPAPCKATKGNCPYGGVDGTENHFDTIEEAQVVADSQNAEKHGIIAIKSYRDDGVNEKAQSKLNEIYGQLENEGQSELNDYYIPYNSDTSMSEQVEKYADAVIRKHKGEDINLEEFSSQLGQQWEKDIEDSYKNGAYDDYQGDGSLYSDQSRRDNESREAFENDLDEVAEVANEFERRVEMIDETYEKANAIDWNKYGINQDEGVSLTIDYASQVASD